MNDKFVNSIVYIILILVISIGFVVAEIHLESMKIWILAISFIKFILVTFYFMKLKESHLMWKIVFVSLVSFFTFFNLVI
jgi:hypothetical protein